MKQRIIRQRKDFPACVRQFKQLRGISVGRCVNPQDKIGMENAAHAHSNFFDKYRGWICLTLLRQLREPFTLLHEVAHLIANKTNNVPPHGKEWRKVVKAIGGTYKAYAYPWHVVAHKHYRDFSHANPQRKK